MVNLLCYNFLQIKSTIIILQSSHSTTFKKLPNQDKI
jgi:hypothetical protein